MFVYVVLLLFLKSCDSSLTVEYVQNIIKENIAATEHFNFPKKYEEFVEGQRSSQINDFGNFDFIIVGAGSAGSVLATRLSEFPFWKILLIEAGGEEDLFNRIPGMLLYTQLSKRNWGFFSTPQRNCCLGMENKMCVVPRGKLIGGSSSINVLAYTRGNPEDYDKWAGIGCPNWSYANILKYFIKSENCQINGDPGLHGYGGLFNVQYVRPPTDKYPYFVKANEELGQKFLDFNGCEQVGVARFQNNIKRGFRVSTGTDFLDYARERENLQVLTNALVTKIIIDKERQIAEGVVFIKNDKKFKATAKIEVIISGGSINSPQLLMLSGIGPKQHLEDLDIDFIKNLSVGQKLIEHPSIFGMVFRTNYSVQSDNQTRQIEQLLRGEGPLTNPLLCNGVSFVRSSNSSSKRAPDYEYLIAQFTKDSEIVAKGFNFNKEIRENFLKKLNPATDFMIFVVFLHPDSRGQITLKSKDPTDMPNVDLNMMAELNDIRRTVEALERLLTLSKTEAFKRINATLMDLPICKKIQKYSFQHWECIVRHMSTTMYHPAGTCRMGPNENVAVVDCEFKVFGIKKLRVVDASVIPVTISGHLNAPTIMLAEKAADLIKSTYGDRDWRKKSCKIEL